MSLKLKKLHAANSASKTNLRRVKSDLRFKLNSSERQNKREKIHKSYTELVQQLEFDEKLIDFEKLNERLSILIDDGNKRKLSVYLRNKFDQFDVQKTGRIELSLLKDCLYTLNLCPSEDEYIKLHKALVNLLEYQSFEKNKSQDEADTQSQLSTNKPLRRSRSRVRFEQKQKFSQEIELKLSFEDFFSLTISILLTNKYKCASSDTLRDAFRIIAGTNTGFISWSSLQTHLTTFGDKFTQEEVQNLREFLNVTDKIDYEEYSKSLYVNLKIPKLYRLKNEQETEQEIVESFFGAKFYS